MVKVWYEPPPYGPRTSLNRPAYGNGGDIGPRWVVRLGKMAPGKVIAGFLAGFTAIAYIPLSKCFYICVYIICMICDDGYTSTCIHMYDA